MTRNHSSRYSTTDRMELLHRFQAVVLPLFVFAVLPLQGQESAVPFPATAQTSITDCSTPTTVTLASGGTVTFQGGQFIRHADSNFNGVMYATSSAAGCGRSGPDQDELRRPITMIKVTFSKAVPTFTVTAYNFLSEDQAIGASPRGPSGSGLGGVGHQLPAFQFTSLPWTNPFPPFPLTASFTMESFTAEMQPDFTHTPTSWAWGITSLKIPQTSISATGQILDGSAMETKTGVTPDQPIYAQVPLGLELRIGILRNGSYIRSKFNLSPATLAAVASPTLYPTNVVLEYARDVHEERKTFRGVHIGTQMLTVTPDDTSIQPFTFTLGVFDPGSLGNSDVQYDPQIVTWGNRRGIPPHILKGLIKKETGAFNPNEYRYEPLNSDTGDIGVSVNNYVLETPPYEHYRMATADGLSRGDLQLDLNSGVVYTTPDDVSPRQVLSVPRGPNQSLIRLRPVDVCPRACVSAKEILLANDNRQNWTDYASFDINDPADLATVDFTAQTPLAASYGLMQTMYVVAAELNWSTTDGRRNPSLLFDTVVNTAAGGGSLAVGTLEFYKRYRASRAGDFATDPNFADALAYQSMMTDALNFYNHGNRQTNLTYGDDVWALSQQYLPAHPLSRIFP